MTKKVSNKIPRECRDCLLYYCQEKTQSCHVFINISSRFVKDGECAAKKQTYRNYKEFVETELAGSPSRRRREMREMRRAESRKAKFIKKMLEKAWEGE